MFELGIDPLSPVNRAHAAAPDQLDQSISIDRRAERGFDELVRDDLIVQRGAVPERLAGGTGIGSQQFVYFLP